MSKKANPTLIGSFVVGAIVITIFAVYFFASQTLFGKKDRFILYFSQSVNSLDPGVAVKFKGVPVGCVESVLLAFQGEKEYVPVIVEIPRRITKRMKLDTDANFLEAIQKGLRGTLGSQSFLTGKHFIELDFFPDQEAVFVSNTTLYKEIPTVMSNSEKMWIAAQKVLGELESLDFKGTAKEIKNAAQKLNSKLDQFDVKSINTKLISSLDSFGSFSGKLDKQVDPVADDFKKTLSKAGSSFDEVKKAATSVDNMINPNSSEGGQLYDTLEDIAKTSRSIRGFVDYLERNPNALLSGKKLSNE